MSLHIDPVRRRAVRRLTAWSVGCLLNRVAVAEAPLRQQAPWPRRPLHLVVAGVAGGGADLLAHLLEKPLSLALGQPVVIDPRPGAGGLLAVAALEAAPHDAQTYLVAVNSVYSELPHAIKTSVDIAATLVPLAELASAPLVLIGGPQVPAKDLQQLLAWIRRSPSPIACASFSTGSISHVLGLLLARHADLRLTHVGYRGSLPALTDVMGGHVALMFDALPTSLPLIRATKVQAYAVTSPERVFQLSAVPTFAEQGLDVMTATAWLGLWRHRDDDPVLGMRLRSAVLTVLRDPAVRERLIEIGYTPGGDDSGAMLEHRLRAESARMRETLRAIGYTPE